MKNSFTTLTVAAVAMTLSLGQASFAQSGSDSTANSGNTTTSTTVQRDEGPDMSWLGLLGLAGLAGLLKKPERQVVHDTTVHTTNPPNTTIR